MKIQVLILALATMSVSAKAIEIREGAKMHVKEMSMWFQNDYDLAVWQRFGDVATPAVMETYRDVVLGCRQAWQFGSIQTVKILWYWPGGHQVNVEMLIPGKVKFDGSKWSLDDRDLVE